MPVLNRNGIEIEIDSTMEVENAHTRFSRDFPKAKQSRISLIRGNSLIGYDIDKFGQVIFLERTFYRGKLINKVHFIVDPGFVTWRISKNLVIYDGERGCVNIKTEEERFLSIRHRDDRKPKQTIVSTFKGETTGMLGYVFECHSEQRGKEDSSKIQWVH